MKVCKVSEIRELDRKAMEEYGVAEEILMENAGMAVYSVILKEFGVKGRSFVVFCGPGNNGGDGFVVARLLHSNGATVRVFILGGKEKYKGAAKVNLERVEKLPIEIMELKRAEEAGDAVNTSDAIVDGIFGVGLSRNVDGVYRDVIQLINERGKKVFAIDIPSGINGDTGQEMGASVKASCTVTFGLPKIGNLVYPGYGKCGKLYVSHISYPASLQSLEWIKVEVPDLVPLPERDPNTTKFSYGPSLFIAGSRNYFWAPIASAYSFLKAGGGYAYLACPASLAPFLAERGREVVFLPQKNETSDGSLSLKAKEGLLKACSERRPKIVVLGPGLSTNEETQQLVRELAEEIQTPLLIDGDGITAISKSLDVIKAREAPTILTPHTGEMARITGIAREEIENNRVEVLQKYAEELNAIIVLKGPHTLIGYPDRTVYINLSGDTGGMAGMATAGTGDVLNGTIAAMYCLGLSIEDAVRTGVFIHGLAGDLAAMDIGPDGMVASDVMEYLPRAVKYYRENFKEISENFYNKIHVI
ncbi:MAG: NAD(P)H-hydrate dehydratase [Nitrososphaerota archaeon]|nr:NAD(P)H-hydrate dehydratase [Candidatus Bathyarchaeota archaeon]MDW8023736.1 NAD(P)H-hydrate dehydratase [Nitrososphaerota archaeon]